MILCAVKVDLSQIMLRHATSGLELSYASACDEASGWFGTLTQLARISSVDATLAAGWRRALKCSSMEWRAICASPCPRLHGIHHGIARGSRSSSGISTTGFQAPLQ
jgi:hypothetical protein